VLYREVSTDDVASNEWHYIPIKVLNEEGRKYADVEIPYFKSLFDVEDVKARTIRPDGTVVPFTGKIFKKLVVRSRGTKMEAKTFTLPEVQPGSIIEYQYKLQLEPSVYFPTTWNIQHELFTRRARFSSGPTWEARRTSAGPPTVARGRGEPKANKEEETVELEVTNVPAFEKEEFMPPERMLQERVEFFYSRQEIETPDQFWKREGKEWNDVAEEFIGKRKGIERAMAETIAAAADTPETKLRKLYARVQQIRNLTFEEEKTEKEAKREKIKESNNVEDVWKRGYGYRTEINRLFVSLVRAAGFQAIPVRVSERDDYFFLKDLLEWRQLNGEVAYVKAGDKEYYLDPGTPFCPFGLLPAYRTGVQGLRLSAEGGVFVKTPEPLPEQATVVHKAALKLSEDGALEGTLETTYTGQEALERRLSNKENDEAGRRKSLEDELKDLLPTGAEVTLEQVTGWDASEEPLRAHFRVRVPDFAAPTGRRLLVPLGVFHTTKKNPFEHEARHYAVYFDYPYEQDDEVMIELPAGFGSRHCRNPATTILRLGVFADNVESGRAAANPPENAAGRVLLPRDGLRRFEELLLFREGG
jgi:hypothetical protein